MLTHVGTQVGNNAYVAASEPITLIGHRCPGLRPVSGLRVGPRLADGAVQAAGGDGPGIC